MSCRPHQPRRRAAECLEIPQGIKRRTGSGSDPIDSDRIDFNILLSKRGFQSLFGILSFAKTGDESRLHFCGDVRKLPYVGFKVRPAR